MRTKLKKAEQNSQRYINQSMHRKEGQLVMTTICKAVFLYIVDVAIPGVASAWYMGHYLSIVIFQYMFSLAFTRILSFGDLGLRLLGWLCGNDK